MAASKVHAQESKNQRVAGSRESPRLVRFGLWSFRRPLPGPSFPRACPMSRAAGNTFLSRPALSVNAIVCRPTRNALGGRPSYLDERAPTTLCQTTATGNQTNDGARRRTDPGASRASSLFENSSCQSLLTVNHHTDDFSTLNCTLGTRRRAVARRLPAGQGCVKLASWPVPFARRERRSAAARRSAARYARSAAVPSDWWRSRAPPTAPIWLRPASTRRLWSGSNRKSTLPRFCRRWRD